MEDKVVYHDAKTMMVVNKDGPFVYMWFVAMGEKPITFVMMDDNYKEMVTKMVEVANAEDKDGKRS